jgi:hypothetical protein
VKHARPAEAPLGQSRAPRRSGPSAADSPPGDLLGRPVLTAPVSVQPGRAGPQMVPRHGPLPARPAGPAA